MKEKITVELPISEVVMALQGRARQNLYMCQGNWKLADVLMDGAPMLTSFEHVTVTFVNEEKTNDADNAGN